MFLDRHPIAHRQRINRLLIFKAQLTTEIKKETTMYDRDKLIDRILELDGKVSKQAERIKALEEALEPFKKLAIEVSNNRFIGDLNRNEVLYAYNKAEIKLIDLSEVLDVLNPIK